MCEPMEALVVLLLPSPNCQYQAAIVPSGSKEPEPSNDTVRLVLPVRSGPAFAIGSWFALMIVLVVDDVDVDVVGGFEVEVEVDVEVEDDVLVVVVEVVVLRGLAAEAGLVNAIASSSADTACARLPPVMIISCFLCA